MCPRNQATDYPPLRASCRFKGCLAVTESRALTPNIGSSSACSIRQTSRNRRSRCQCTGRQAPLQRRVDSREPGRFTPPADLRFWTLLPLEGPTGRRRRRNYQDLRHVTSNSANRQFDFRAGPSLVTWGYITSYATAAQRKVRRHQENWLGRAPRSFPACRCDPRQPRMHPRG
jgi:hypothetical protein